MGVGDGGVGSSPVGRGGPVPTTIQVGGGEVFSPGLTLGGVVGGAVDGGEGGMTII